jgi:hypothetical protein
MFEMGVPLVVDTSDSDKDGRVEDDPAVVEKFRDFESE